MPPRSSRNYHALLTSKCYFSPVIASYRTGPLKGSSAAVETNSGRSIFSLSQNIVLQGIAMAEGLSLKMGSDPMEKQNERTFQLNLM